MDLQTSLIYFVDDGIIAGKSTRTLETYRYTVTYLFNFIKGEFLPFEASSLNEAVIQRFFINGIKVKKWGRVYHWTVYQKLNVYLNWCVRKQILPSNPLANIPKPKLPQLPPKSLTEKEAVLLLRAVSSLKTHYYFTTLRNKALIATLLLTGLRKSELVNLRFKDVDVVNDFLSVERGKGGKKREIPIETQTLKPILEEYINYRVRLGKDSEWFFNGTFAGRGNDNQIAVSTIDRLFTRLSKIKDKKVSAHKLRHSFATLLLDKTGDIYTLQQLMGHSNISTTCIYLSSTRKKKIEAISTLKLGSEK